MMTTVAGVGAGAVAGSGVGVGAGAGTGTGTGIGTATTAAAGPGSGPIVETPEDAVLAAARAALRAYLSRVHPGLVTYMPALVELGGDYYCIRARVGPMRTNRHVYSNSSHHELTQRQTALESLASWFHRRPSHPRTTCTYQVRTRIHSSATDSF